LSVCGRICFIVSLAVPLDYITVVFNVSAFTKKKGFRTIKILREQYIIQIEL
jgi:hypothetical protein